MLPVGAILFALVVAALPLAACGGGDHEVVSTVSPTAQAVTVTPAPTETLTVTLPPTDEVVTVTPSPTEVATVAPSPTEVLCPDTPSILRPEPGAAVAMITEVELEVEPPELSDQHPHVLVRPIPDDPNQDYWVQAKPTSMGNCRWISKPVYVGERTDPSGLPFRICAVVTDDTLSRGQRLYELPQGPSHCIDVTRQ